MLATFSRAMIKKLEVAKSESSYGKEMPSAWGVSEMMRHTGQGNPFDEHKLSQSMGRLVRNC